MEHNLTFSYTARYFKSGSIGPGTQQVWFVLHGYGQLAQYFLQKFKPLEEYNICVIAPEALSRFYLENPAPTGNRTNDRVGATWMTKENRLTDIENYVNFLNSVYQKEMGDRDIPVTVLGFSQGAATASRWVSDGKIKFNRLVLWAGMFPPDMNFETTKTILKGKETYLVSGKSDPLLTDSRFAEMKLISEKLGITPTHLQFDGAHELDRDTLVKLATSRL